MKERPIIFTPENAQKSHVGTKWETRRLNGLDEVNKNPESWDCTLLDSGDAVFIARPRVSYGHRQIKCPYGVVGDRLWIREAIKAHSDVMVYAANGQEVQQDGLVWPSIHERKTIPSLHMPRWACRTVVEITDVRVQRLQEISEEDAKAEGIDFHNGLGIGHSGYRHCKEHGYVYATAIEAFKVLWASIHGPESWALNPFVWAITFKKVTEAT